MTTLPGQHANRQIAIWLIVVAVVIYAMIILGGVTRLTHSGLSMVEWKPIMGIVPPLTEESWQEAFLQYQQFPEYQKMNKGMSLGQFKTIFLFEYAHRILGRLIGLFFLLPFLYFLFRGYINKQLVPRLIVMFVLGGLQGLLGWYMVKSGLVDNPRVSQYRLTAHLGFAVIIYAYILWVAFGLLGTAAQSGIRSANTGIKQFGLLITGLLFFMILSGGMVAGTHAGLVYNTFPLMGDGIFPPGLYSGGWLSAFEDPVTIQFNHRMFAYALILLITAFSVLLLQREAAGTSRVAVYVLLAALLAQVSLGIMTLLNFVPVTLAAAHQGGAILLFTISLYITHNLCYQ